MTLKRQNVDFDSLVIKVTGKGRKERIVTISIELRKAFFRLFRKFDFDLVFCTQRGNPLSYRNREFLSLIHYESCQNSFLLLSVSCSLDDE